MLSGTVFLPLSSKTRIVSNVPYAYIRHPAAMDAETYRMIETTIAPAQYGVRFLFPGDILNRQVHDIHQNGYCRFSKNRV